jgi:S-DNA-T family DNA segregation ATPase FtsK/SpoIIIE
MDIVVNTPHGDADVSIVAHGPDATLADLLVMVTGQAVPLLADVDGHPVRCSTVLAGAGLAMGSIVTTESVPPEPTTESEIALVQLTGSGSGRSIRLGPGRYRIGPGRRLSADELHEAPVETAAFELTVEAPDSPDASAPTTRVEVVPADLQPLVLDATAVDSATPWDDEYLTAANRVFLLDASPVPVSRSVEAPDDDGLIPFHRSPRRHPRTTRRPVIDAVTDAALVTAELWAQRSGQDGAFVVPIGMRSTAGRPTEVTLDLARSPVVAVTGNDRFRTAMARTIIVELATLHGPADLDIAIIPGPDQTAAWEWAKWLPHVRLGGDPMIHRDRRHVTDWTARLGETPWGPGHLTLVVIDDRTQWTVPGSPLRDLMAAAPEGLRVLALCERERDAPSESAVIVSGSNAGSAHLDLLDRDAETVEFLPSLIETDTARIAAQHLAPLLDVEMPPRSTAAPAGPPPADGANDDLARLLAPTSVTAEEIRTRWRSAEVGPTTVAVGFRDGQLVTLDLDDAGDVLVTGATIDAALDCAASIAIGLAAIRPPGAVWMAAVANELFPQLQAIGRLPHTAATPEGPVDVRRVVARVEALLSGPTGPSHVVLVAPLMGGSGAAPLLDGDAIGSLLEASAHLRGLHVIVATDHLESTMHDALESQVGTTIAIATSTTGRRATIVTRPASAEDDDPVAAFSPYEPRRVVTGSSIELRPAVIGRRHTPLERRLARAARRSSTDIDPAMNAVVDAICDAAATMDVDPPVLIPAPLATTIDAEAFFRTHQGDGVPIGMIDDVREALTRPLWWEPGSGPLVLFGSRRSGVDAVITTVLSGIVDRFAPADVRVAAIEPSESRRSALRRVDHVRAVAAPDSPQDMSALLDLVAEALDRASPDDARLVVVVGDLGLVRRDLGPLTERFDDLLAATSGEDSGIDLIVYAGDRSTAGPLWHDGVRCLVGSSSDAAELSAFDIADLRSLDGVGRCRRFPGGELVQLATRSDPLETILIGDAP